jgi:ATP-dependent Clp protease adaptor protein ClpS
VTACVVMTAPAPEKTEVVDPVTAADVPWVTIVWNDPVNLMSYVTLVFQKLLGHPRPKAEALMLDVHHKGRATVSNGPREKMEADVAKLQAAGLWATMAKDC